MRYSIAPRRSTGNAADSANVGLRVRRASLFALVLLAATGCRREEPLAGTAATIPVEETPAETPDAAAIGEPDAAPAVAGTVSGRIRIDGTPPPRVTRTVNADRELCGDGTVVDREMIVDPVTAGVRYAVVTLTNDTAGHAAPAPVTRTVEQAKCEYYPFITVVPPGSRIVVKNADAGLHDVHVMPEDGAEPSRNHSLRADGRVELTFAEPDHVLLGCDLHYWARAWVIVDPAPFAAVTDAQGRYAFEGVPPGDWRLTVWHERLGTAVRDIEVLESGPAAVEDVALPPPLPSRPPRP